jgi:hypothetical protein
MLSAADSSSSDLALDSVFSADLVSALLFDSLQFVKKILIDKIERMHRLSFPVFID